MTRQPLILLLLLLAGLHLHSAQPLTAPPAEAGRLPRENLLCCHDRQGRETRVRSRQDWLRRRAEILRGMETIMGPMPGREKQCPLDVRIESEQDEGSFVLQRLTYASETGCRVPAFLLIPKTPSGARKRLPTVLALHSTDMQYGYRVLVEPLRAYYRAYARELAERGFVVLAPAYPLMAGYQPDLRALGYHSGTMKAIWDNRRGLDLLDSLPFVRKGRYGALGHSLGGHNAIYTAVFEPRIVAVVSSCGFDSFLDYKAGDIRGWTSERYMPRLLEYRNCLDRIPFDFHELIGALAPRRVFINAPLRDDNFNWRSVDRIVRAAAPVFELYRVPRHLRVQHPDCGHDFPPDVREAAYAFLRESLQ